MGYRPTIDAMIQYLLDTDTVSHYLRGHPRVIDAIASRGIAEMAMSIITIEELWDGWQAVIRKAKKPDQLSDAYDRLTSTMNSIRQWSVIPFSEAAITYIWIFGSKD